VRFDNNKYSVAASAVGRPVEVHAYADRIVIRQDGRIVAEHPRSFGRGDTVYDPWHYVPVLARKPARCATAHPSRTGCCPLRWSACGANSPVPTTAIGRWSISSPRCSPMGCQRSRPLAPKRLRRRPFRRCRPHILARQRDPGPPATILTPASLTLRHAPIADCARYDNLRRTN